MEKRFVFLDKVLDITDKDFTNPYRDIVLPNFKSIKILNERITGRRVLIKKNVFEKNKNHHPELIVSESKLILTLAFTKVDYAINDKPKGKPN